MSINNVKPKKVDKPNMPSIPKKPTKAKTGTTVSFVVESDAELLDFLFVNLSAMARTKVKALLKYRQVSVDGVVRTKFDYHLKKGQKIEINKTAKPQEILAPVREGLDIIYEDEDIIVINKISGLLSVGTETENSETAFHYLMEYTRQVNPKNRVFVVHRLDRDTSGIFMVAKNEKAKYSLQDNWESVVQKRGYIAVVEGQPNKKQDRIRTWLLQTKTHLMYSSYTPDDGKEAITNYKVIKQSKGFSMLEVEIETGRKNQIRVHMKDIGHNIVGDKKYGSKIDPIRRLGLHAHILEIIHPTTKEILTFTAPIPQQFTTLFGNK